MMSEPGRFNFRVHWLSHCYATPPPCPPTLHSGYGHIDGRTALPGTHNVTFPYEIRPSPSLFGVGTAAGMSLAVLLWNRASGQGTNVTWDQLINSGIAVAATVLGAGG